MRIADSMTFEQTRENLSKNRTKMTDLQNQAATQKKVTKPSDDPVAASRVLAQRVDIQGQDQYLKNLNYAKSFLEFSDQSLGQLNEVLVRVKELALGQANDATGNQQSRRVVGTEVKQLFNQAVMIGNRKLGDRYIFGGYSTTSRPFSANGAYKGDDGEMPINIDKGSFLPMNIPGSRVFLGKGVTADGATVESSPQPNTVEELQNQRQSEREKNETAQVESNENQLSFRGPASVGVRTPDVSEKGDTQVGASVEQGTNIFKVIKDLEISLMANDKKGVQNTIEEIDGAINQVVLSRSQAGSRVMAIDNTVSSLQTARVDAKGIVSSLEDVDMYELVNDISKTESTLQATLQTSGKIIQPSLMDFLR